MTLNLSTLNENQLAAVQWQDGPLLVLAGPGSGKTRVLTYRVARLINESPDNNYKVLGLTFTNKAAGEMRERIDQLVPNARTRVLLTTFHSFCADLLRQHGHHIGLKPDFAILTQQADQEAVLDDVLQAASLAGDYTSDRLLPLITRLLDKNINPEDAETALTNGGVDDAAELARVYSAYRESLVTGNRLDFGALVAAAIRLLQSKPAVRRQVRRIFPLLCDDEFQDTNESQYTVLTHLVDDKTRNLFVVADDDQIIYQWNGASPERLQALREQYNMEVVQLPENYRCPPPVIELANQLIANNISRSDDKEQLRAHKPASESDIIRTRAFKSFADEAEWIAEDIAGRQPSERAKCAVLARTRKVLEVVAGALEAESLSGYLSVRKAEFTSIQMRFLHSVLRLANSRQDREQLRRVCKAFFTLEGISLDVRDVVSLAAAKEGDYLRAWADAAAMRDELEASTRTFLSKGLPHLSDKLAFRPFAAAAFEWFDSIKDLQEPQDEGESEFPEEKQVWEEHVADIDQQFGEEAVSLHTLLQELDLRSKSPEPAPGAIPCFTVHVSKGMEFGHVYLAALVEDQLPSWAAKKKGPHSREMQEERRNCFVAITRAQESLTMTFSAEVFGWSKEPSRFLKEMGADAYVEY